MNVRRSSQLLTQLMQWRKESLKKKDHSSPFQASQLWLSYILARAIDFYYLN